MKKLLALLLVLPGLALAQVHGNAATRSSIPVTTIGLPTLLSQSFVASTAPADTSEDALATITVPPNTLGATGALLVHAHWSISGGGGTKALRIRYSGASGTVVSSQSGTTGEISVDILLGNKSVTNAQATTKFAEVSVASTIADSSADTTAATSAVITCQKVSAGDTCTLKGFTSWVIH